MGDDERLAAIQDELRYLSRMIRDVPETAVSAGKAGAQAYEDGLRHSFIKDTTMRIRRLEILVAVLSVVVVGLATVIGVKLPVLLP